MWPFRKKPVEFPAVEPKPLHSDLPRIYMPIGTLSTLASLYHKQFDDIALVGHGLRACCDAQNFEMPQPILDALLRILKAVQHQHGILKIVLEENGIKGETTEVVQ